jgi:hypothetical protein
MKSAQKDKIYKSPVRKLAHFFEKSRDQWKAKCREAKVMIKRLKSRIRFLEESRARWKRRTKEHKAELARVKAKKQALERELDALKREKAEAPAASDSPDNFGLVPYHHQYSVGHVMLFTSLVLSDAASLRCASSAMETILSALHFSLPCPSWSTGRLWILRLGYYKLARSKERADDWVWLVDHTIQLGAEKCLVILGLRLRDLPPSGRCLSHQDVEPIALFPVQKSNREIVYQQLEETAEKTGVPREIIGDHGSDLKSGVERFCQTHPETCTIYDIKHKTAAVLKHELKHDEAWLTFTQLAAQTKKRVQQTVLAPLAPPNQRTKARYMNVDVLIRWGQNMLTFLDEQQNANLSFDLDQVREKIGWISTFRQQLGEWDELLQIITTTESFVRHQGLHHGSHTQLKERLLPLAHTERTKNVRTHLLAFVAEEEVKAKPNERLLGSSEVIESVLGKLKQLEQDQARSGFTGLLLSVGAMVSTTTAEMVKQALETVPTKQVLAWCKKHLGQSVQARRRAAFASHSRTEQKWDQLWQSV